MHCHCLINSVYIVQKRIKRSIPIQCKKNKHFTFWKGKNLHTQNTRIYIMEDNETKTVADQSKLNYNSIINIVKLYLDRDTIIKCKILLKTKKKQKNKRYYIFHCAHFEILYDYRTFEKLTKLI